MIRVHHFYLALRGAVTRNREWLPHPTSPYSASRCIEYPTFGRSTQYIEYPPFGGYEYTFYAPLPRR
eukprot:3684146-Ditylum_brightwellii.AAC.1